MSKSYSKVPKVYVDFNMCKGSHCDINVPIEVWYHTPEEEISNGPACYLWDYLWRSKAWGFFLPLSGGLDSASVCTLVFSMSRIVLKEILEGNIEVLH